MQRLCYGMKSSLFKHKAAQKQSAFLKKEKLDYNEKKNLLFSIIRTTRNAEKG